MGGVVILEPNWELLEDGEGVRAGVHSGVVALRVFTNASQTPLLSGLRGGVEQATRFRAVAKSTASFAV